MSEQESPWARPDPGVQPGSGTQPEPGGQSGSSVRVEHPPRPVPPRVSTPTGFPSTGLPPAGRPPYGPPPTGPLAPEHPTVDPFARARPAESIDLGPGWSRAGNVTALGTLPVPDVLEVGPDEDTVARQRKRMVKIFGGTAGVIVAVGLVVILALLMTGHSPLHNPLAHGPKDVLPPLAKACPPPSADAQNLPPAPPPPPGTRTVDTEAGISYAAQGAPWLPWRENWSGGDLHVQYGVGQHFVTEEYVDEIGALRQYHASILSGSVPAAANDALTLDLKCTGHQVLADVRLSYYPQPNTIEMMRDEVTILGGRPAWVTKFRLHFHQQGLKATSELVGLALIDVGRPNAAVLYISIPGTHTQFDPVVDAVLDSVRPT